MQNVEARRCLLASVASAMVLLNGCGVVVRGNPGLGGVGPANGASLNGSLTSSLPGPGSGQNAPGGQLAGGSTTTAGGAVGQRVRAAAETLPVPFPYAPGTEGGNLGCADVVSNALERAGVMSRGEHQLAVAGVVSVLSRKGWRNAGAPYADGDVIVWDPLPGGKHQHIGIIVVENGTPYAIHNSSSQRRPVKVPLSSMGRAVDRVMRAPGSVV